MRYLLIIAICLIYSRLDGQSLINQNDSSSILTANEVRRKILPKEVEEFDRRRRTKIEKPEETIERIRIKAGMKIGEAGAGNGYFTFYLSEKVGGDGVIFANDISEFSISSLEFYAREFCIEKNIVCVLGKIDDPLFPVNELDMIVIYHSFHDFEMKQEWLINAKKYLKDRGRLIIIDSYNPTHTNLTSSSLNRMVKNAGYKLLSHKKYFWHEHIFEKN